MDKRAKRNLTITGLFAGLIIILVIAFTDTNQPAPVSDQRGADTISQASDIPTEINNSSWDGSVFVVKRYLEKNLNDPDSYEGIEWSPVQDTGNQEGVNFRYTVRHKYRAKNALGGYVVKNQLFYINKDGQIVDVSDID